MKKASGILCHITSLPSPYGVGDFGPISYDFINKLSGAGQSYWQILPIGNTDETGCPYATDSAFGCAEYYFSPELLALDLKFDIKIFDHLKLDSKKVNFKSVQKNKLAMLKIAFDYFNSNDSGSYLDSYQQFLKNESDWVFDYAKFRALKSHTQEFFLFSQFVCFGQLLKLKNHANNKNIKIVGDLPIFVSFQSMDVLKYPEEFFLNAKGEMEYETGAAPDGFSASGQKWGTPVYNWEAQKRNNYTWWNKRLSFLKRYFDVIRIDHFRGFVATWISPVNDPDASEGHWYPGPGADLFSSLTHYPEVFAEDLGYITKEVEDLRDQFQFPSMKVFEFMSDDESNPHKLTKYNYNSIAYTGTHDCDTLMGWYEGLNAEEKMLVPGSTHWEMIDVLMKTPAKVVFMQVQDLLGLGSLARFNYPGTVNDSNWTWKLSNTEYAKINWDKLQIMTKDNHRLGESLCG